MSPVFVDRIDPLFSKSVTKRPSEAKLKIDINVAKMAQSKQIISALVQKPFVTGLAPAFPLFFVPPPSLSLSPFLASFPLSPKWQSWQIISFAIAWERGGRSVGGGPRSAIIPLLSPPFLVPCAFPLLPAKPR